MPHPIIRNSAFSHRISPPAPNDRTPFEDSRIVALEQQIAELHAIVVEQGKQIAALAQQKTVAEVQKDAEPAKDAAKGRKKPQPNASDVLGD